MLAGAMAASLAHAEADAGAAPEAPVPVAIEQDRITGEFMAVAPEEALRQVAQATGADVVGTVLGVQPITLRLDDVPLDVAVARILGTQSFSLVFDADGGLRRIRLISVPAVTPVAGGATRVTTPAPVVANPAQFMSVEVPISTVGPLADALGTGGKATMGQLFELAARSDDAGVRVAAVDAGMAAIERDGNLQTSLDQMLNGVDDASLAAIIRGSVGQRSTELMSRMLSRTRRPTFRQRVVNILRSLRENG
jgi:hypothetical protein